MMDSLLLDVVLDHLDAVETALGFGGVVATWAKSWNHAARCCSWPFANFFVAVGFDNLRVWTEVAVKARLSLCQNAEAEVKFQSARRQVSIATRFSATSLS